MPCGTPLKPLDSAYYRTCCGRAHVETVFTVFIAFDALCFLVGVAAGIVRFTRTEGFSTAAVGGPGVLVGLLLFGIEIYARWKRVPWPLLVHLITSVILVIALAISVIIAVFVVILGGENENEETDPEAGLMAGVVMLGLLWVCAPALIYIIWRASIFHRTRRYYQKLRESSTLVYYALGKTFSVIAQRSI